MQLSEKLAHYRISADEYELIKKHLGREPEGVEWSLFSALWSEHCSYKSSKVHLRKFFSKAEHVLEAEGENAGVIDLGQGERVAFKMESHNHPSFIEPYQGAATGVGGILRDIFTMGARPIALSNYLCFGEMKADRMPELIRGVVKGIGDYGNCVGVPTVTGQTEFNERYNENILVNAMAVGLFEKQDQVFLSKAEGIGNHIVYVGAKTGRDGIHGASMASESFDEDSESKRPTIQIGDPFYEKLLIESCLEVMSMGLVVAIQDMGAAGLTSSSFEMASKGQVGMDMHLDRVPLRDSSMTPEDILLSESQERMLLVCTSEQLPKLQKVFANWGLDATAIGEITDGKNIRLYWHGELLTDIDPEPLVEEAPRYERPYKKWQAVNKQNFSSKEPGKDFLPRLLRHYCAGSREWVYRQYDQRVGAKTAQDASQSVGVVRLPQSGRFLSVVTGCRPHVMRMDAQIGGYDAVAFPSLQMAVQGFKPLAVTDCLNFGNPEKEEIMSEFVASVEAISEVCEKLNTPVVSGNVSFYNETQGRGITSTPATGIVGLCDQAPRCKDRADKEGLKIFSIKWDKIRFSGRLAEISGQKPSFNGEWDSENFASFLNSMIALSSSPEVYAARVCGQFGRAYQLFRFLKGVGFKSESSCQWQDWIEETFYETLVAIDGNTSAEELEKKFAGLEDIKIEYLGKSGGSSLELNESWNWPIDSLEESYQSSLIDAEKEIHFGL